MKGTFHHAVIYGNTPLAVVRRMMAAPVIQTCHVACCANRTPNVLSWGRGGLIAYGTCHSVAIYDPKVNGCFQNTYVTNQTTASSSFLKLLAKKYMAQLR